MLRGRDRICEREGMHRGPRVLGTNDRQLEAACGDGVLDVIQETRRDDGSEHDAGPDRRTSGSVSWRSEDAGEVDGAQEKRRAGSHAGQDSGCLARPRALGYRVRGND